MAAASAPFERTLQEASARLLETAPEEFDLESDTALLPSSIPANLECDEVGGLDGPLPPVAPTELGVCFRRILFCATCMN